MTNRVVPFPLWRAVPLFCFLAAVCLSGCTPERMGLAPREEPGPVHAACEDCHPSARPEEDGKLFADGADPSMLCIYCHHVGQNHHPFAFVPDLENYFVDCGMSDLPLFDEEVRCLTCHEAHGGEGLAETPHLLRGGPYRDRRELCFRCHFQERYATVYAHHMLEEDGSYTEVDGEPVCLLCHAKVPDPTRDRTDDVTFKADVAFLCWRCHPPMPGLFFEQHFLIEPDGNYRRQIEKTEAEEDVILPLVPRNRITCSTCHNPHQEGVLVRKAAQTGADSPMRLRLEKSDLCIACHSLK